MTGARNEPWSHQYFRRILSTETVNGGLPIHIAAKLLGHLDLNTTQAYVAVYPEEVIRHHRQFVDKRRTHRPSEEYREPSDTEWQDFRDHFSLRKVALGTCDRPYGTPCQHENACIRCPMLRLDLSQEPRLLEIEANTRQRLGEAQRMRWLGEVAGLREPAAHRRQETAGRTPSSPNRPRGGRGRRSWLSGHASAMIWAFRRSYSATASGT
ncbi:tyrosine-type recombinase/integrase [Streptomyces sp. NPDC001401]|uniref:tyrosine-type recombinase/integrase n=1 Tax=Streptomyces sp. NPDC001401 TaxID=3364570 RepID=UPI003688D0B2